jgi:hypothetical protein
MRRYRFASRAIRLFGFASLACAATAFSQDFSKTNSVTINLADAERSVWVGGLTHALTEPDGVTTATNVQGVACRVLSLSEQRRNKGYLYFAIDPTFKQQGAANVRVDVDYFDGFAGHTGVMGLEFDSSEFGDFPNASYKAQLPNVPLRGSEKWMRATFRIRGAAFRNSQNAGADFRLWASPPELFVSRVTVMLDPPKEATEPKPLTFDAKSEVKLRDWNIQWDSGAKPSFASGTNDGARWLEIKAPEEPGSGSWRTSVLLAPGQYQFVGRVRTQGAEGGGVGLRASYHQRGRLISSALEWTNLTYEFSLTGTEFVELVAEFLGIKGSARFDADSLKLIRKKSE